MQGGLLIIHLSEQFSQSPSVFLLIPSQHDAKIQIPAMHNFILQRVFGHNARAQMGHLVENVEGGQIWDGEAAELRNSL